MKWSKRNWFLCVATVLAVAASILLPPRLSNLADQSLMGRDYSTPAELLDISLVYRLSTAERITLFSRLTEGSLFAYTSGSRSQDELSAEQAFAVCQEELAHLGELGVIPVDFSAATLLVSSYVTYFDPENAQQKLSLWRLMVSGDAKSGGGELTVTMDAETGLIYALFSDLPVGTAALDAATIVDGWGTYLEFGAPVSVESQPVTKEFFSNTVATFTQDTLKYQADGETLIYYLLSNENASTGGIAPTFILSPVLIK